MIAVTRNVNQKSPHTGDAGFLMLLPKIEQRAKVLFHGLSCASQRADKIAEVIALAWKWYVRLAEQGKDVTLFPTVFVGFVTKAVQSGRRLCGHEKARDVMSPLAQRRHAFKLEYLPQSTN